MDEISDLLKSGVWWFSLLVAFIVGILSNHFVDWVGKFFRVIGNLRLRRSRKAKRRYLNRLRHYEKHPELWPSAYIYSKQSLESNISLSLFGMLFCPLALLFQLLGLQIEQFLGVGKLIDILTIGSFVVSFLLIAIGLIYSGFYSADIFVLVKIRDEIYGKIKELEISDEELDKIEV